MHQHCYVRRDGRCPRCARLRARQPSETGADGQERPADGGRAEDTDKGQTGTGGGQAKVQEQGKSAAAGGPGQAPEERGAVGVTRAVPGDTR